LCTFGITCKAIVDAALDSDVSRVASYGARFAGVVYPGEMLLARIWQEGDGRFVATVSAPSRDDAAVLSGVELVSA
jgi:acyl dehydratase